MKPDLTAPPVGAWFSRKNGGRHGVPSERPSDTLVVLSIELPGRGVELGRVDAVTFDETGRAVPKIGRRTWSSLEHLAERSKFTATDPPARPSAVIVAAPTEGEPVPTLAAMMTEIRALHTKLDRLLAANARATGPLFANVGSNGVHAE